MILPRTSSELALLGPVIPRDGLRPGDLLFFAAGDEITHVGVYLGNERFAHASTTVGISINSLLERYYATRFAFGTRIIVIR